MKTLWITISAIALLAFAGCNQKSEVKEMLNDTTSRENIFTEIISDHQLMTE